MVGLLRFIRNIDAHAGQAVSAGRFESEDAVRHYLLDPFPWLTMAVYRIDEKHGLTDVPKVHLTTPWSLPKVSASASSSPAVKDVATQ